MARQERLLPLEDQHILSELRTAVGTSDTVLLSVSFDGLVEY